MSVGTRDRPEPRRARAGSSSAAGTAAPPWAAELGPAFAAELRRRLPRLDAAARRLRERRTGATVATVREVVTHTHALASSAVVMGELDAARAARACELRLLGYVETGKPPATVVDDAVGQLDTALEALHRWCAGAPTAWRAPVQPRPTG